MKGKTRLAKLPEYIRWLTGYMKRGNMPSIYYNYPFTKAGFLIACEDIRIEYSDRSALSIIVPQGLNYSTEGQDYIGVMKNHTVYLDKGYKVVWKYGEAGFLVPVYNDPEFLELKGLERWIQKKSR